MFYSGCYQFTTREMEEGAISLVDFEVSVQDVLHTLQTTSTLFDKKITSWIQKNSNRLHN